VRVSIDAKDRVKVGLFSKGGSSRVEVRAYDHDFGNEYITPFGIMDVKNKTTSTYLTTKVTADFMADMLEKWWVDNGYSNSGKKLLLNLDNGPECSSHRTQFMKRMIEFSIDYNVEVTLAYYPPYHSKYNPVERVWGVLEQHWNGELLDSVETIKKYIESATYDHKYLKSEIIEAVYETGVKVKQKVMKIYEKALERIAGLEDYFVRISPKRCIGVLPYAYCFC
jgi:transposase